MSHPQGVGNYHANKDLKIPSIEGYQHEINYNHQKYSKGAKSILLYFFISADFHQGQLFQHFVDKIGMSGLVVT